MVVVVDGGSTVELVVGADVVEGAVEEATVVVLGGRVVVVGPTADVGAVDGAIVDEGTAAALRAAAVTTLELSGDGRLVTSSRTLDTAEVASTIEASVAAAQAMKVPIFRRT